MKVLHLVTYDTGGAARAAYRISSALNKNNIDSKLLVLHKSSDYINVITKTNFKSQKIYAKLLPHIDALPLKLYNHRQKVIFSLGFCGIDISNYDLVQESDIIHLHWINSGFLSVKNISQLLNLNKPVVWTFHDMWPFTGGCHYSYNCINYKTHCGNCPILNSKKNKDLSYKVLKQKQKQLRRDNLSIVTCSNWLSHCTKESALFKDSLINVIPNCIDIDTFKPIDKNTAKEILNIDKTKKIILFGAANSTSDERKGFRYLAKSIEYVKNKLSKSQTEYELLVFGASYSTSISDFPFNVKFLGNLYDDYSLALCYSAADVFVAPSLEENLANTVMEALSCGTPVVAFNIGGMPDMVRHKYNGYLAEAFSYEDLGNGILWCTSNENKSDLIKNSRNYVLSNYTYSKIAEQYRNLYTEKEAVAKLT